MMDSVHFSQLVPTSLGHRKQHGNRQKCFHESSSEMIGPGLLLQLDTYVIIFFHTVLLSDLSKQILKCYINPLQHYITFLQCSGITLFTNPVQRHRWNNVSCHFSGQENSWTHPLIHNSIARQEAHSSSGSHCSFIHSRIYIAPL